MKKILLILLFLFLSESISAQEQIPANLWQGLIAENVAEGYTGMYDVACVVRNRIAKGMNSGLCGLKRKDLYKFCKKEGARAEKTAKNIVQKVFYDGGKDTTGGAVYFENIKVYGWPTWTRNKKIIITVKRGCHTFFNLQ